MSAIWCTLRVPARPRRVPVVQLSMYVDQAEECGLKPDERTAIISLRTKVTSVILQHYHDTKDR